MCTRQMKYMCIVFKVERKERKYQLENVETYAGIQDITIDTRSF
jgi:hypothetical protein